MAGNGWIARCLLGSVSRDFTRDFNATLHVTQTFP